VKNLNYLFWAYTLIWIVLAGYLLSLSVRLRALSSQVRRLKARLHPGPGAGEPGE
jgi:CcmD family protein